MTSYWGKNNIPYSVVVFKPDSFSVFCYTLSINPYKIYLLRLNNKDSFFSPLLLIFMNLSQDELASNFTFNLH